MTERINRLISQLGLSERAFALSCGLPQNTLTNQLNGVRKLSLSTVMAILSAYPLVSAEWLLRGNGSMFMVAKMDNEPLSLIDAITRVQDAIDAAKDENEMLLAHIKYLEAQIKN